MEETRGLEAETRSDPRALFQIQTDEPENEANPARSLFVQLKHAQDKPCGLRQRFRRALGTDAPSES